MTNTITRARLLVFLIVAVSIGFPPVARAADELPHLRVSENRRFLVTTTGAPFFWLGDTAWELFHRASREDAERYLRKRAEQRFTVIQAVALAEMDGLHVPNAYGELPLRNDDPTQPNDAYFAHVDWVVAKANVLGLYVGLLPTWASVLKSSHRPMPRRTVSGSASATGTPA